MSYAAKTNQILKDKGNERGFRDSWEGSKVLEIIEKDHCLEENCK